MLKKIYVFSSVFFISFLLLITSFPLSSSAEYVSGENVSFASGNYSYSDCEDILSLSITNNSSYDTGYDVLEHYTTSYPIDSYYHFCYILSDGSTSYFIFYFLDRTAEFSFDTSLSSIRAYTLHKSTRNAFMISSSGVLTVSGGYLQADTTWTCTLNSSYSLLGSSSSTKYECVYIASGTSIGLAPELIEVEFAPELDGCINLVHDSSWMPGASSTVTLTSFDFWVKNNTNQPYIYNLTIYDSSYSNVIYRYLKYEWCMSIDLKSQSLTDVVYMRQLQGSAWHLVQAGDTVHNVINWSQVNLKTNTIYNVEVQAVPNIGNDFDTTSYIMPMNTGLAEFEVDTVYSSSFSITDMGNIVYSHDDDQYDIIPYQTEEDFVRASLSRKASFSQGTYDYNNYSAYDDKNSLYYSDSDAGTYFRNNYAADKDSGSSSSFSSYFNPVSFSSNGVSPVSFTSLSAMITQFMQFSNTTLSYFPSAILSVFTLGLVSIVVIGLIKAVFR